MGVRLRARPQTFEDGSMVLERFSRLPLLSAERGGQLGASVARTNWTPERSEQTVFLVGAHEVIECAELVKFQQVHAAPGGVAD
jgi:hypothetical protein